MTRIVAVDWVGGKVRFLDQTLLPAEEVYIDASDPEGIAEAIRALRIRGAPAIGVAAAFGVCLAARNGSPADIHAAIATLAATRPTAVNLFRALDRMRSTLGGLEGSDGEALRRRLLDEALAIQREDVAACRRISELGAALIPANAHLMTHCNAGALATAGEGTALGVILEAARQGKVLQVFVNETRPLFQGARLTAWELVRQDVAACLITDSTAGSVLAGGGITAVIVGADRIAANGDTANKIGTYSLAVLARHHRVPFYVAAPVTTVDPATPGGAAITVEERDPAEITHVFGRRIAAERTRVFAPAFDITPASLITAIITDCGVLRPPFPPGIAALSRLAGT